MKPTLIIEENLVDDSETFYLKDDRGEHELFSTSHDSLGWDGMGIINDGMHALAERLDLEVEHRAEAESNLDDGESEED